jgi:hypothetical protein
MSFDGIAAVMFYLFLNGDLKRSLLLGGLWLFAVIACTLLLQLLYPYYWLNAWSAVAMIYDFRGSASLSFSFMVPEFPVLALAVLNAVQEGPRKSLCVSFFTVALMRDTASTVHWVQFELFSSDLGCRDNHRRTRA